MLEGFIRQHFATRKGKLSDQTPEVETQMTPKSAHQYLNPK
jgi:hypothetical protein